MILRWIMLANSFLDAAKYMTHVQCRSLPSSIVKKYVYCMFGVYSQRRWFVRAMICKILHFRSDAVGVFSFGIILELLDEWCPTFRKRAVVLHLEVECEMK